MGTLVSVGREDYGKMAKRGLTFVPRTPERGCVENSGVGNLSWYIVCDSSRSQLLCVHQSSRNEVLTNVEVDLEVWDEVGDRLEEVQDVAGPTRLGLLPFDRKDLSISASKPSQKVPSVWHPRKEREVCLRVRT